MLSSLWEMYSINPRMKHFATPKLTYTWTVSSLLALLRFELNTTYCKLYSRWARVFK